MRGSLFGFVPSFSLDPAINFDIYLLGFKGDTDSEQL